MPELELRLPHKAKVLLRSFRILQRNSESKRTQDIETPALHLTQRLWGTIGVYDDSPQGLADAIDQLGPDFFRQQKPDDPEYISGSRDKFATTLVLPSGNFRVYVKEKNIYGGTAKQIYDEYRFYRRQYTDYLNEHKQEIEDPRHVEILAFKREDMEGALTVSSILHELRMNRLAAARYKNAYGEELPVERPFGFVVTREGRKWTIFEYIDNVVPYDWVIKQVNKKVSQRYELFWHKIDSRLRIVGIFLNDANVVMIGNPRQPDSMKFVLIDSERWQIACTR